MYTYLQSYLNKIKFKSVFWIVIINDFQKQKQYIIYTYLILKNHGSANQLSYQIHGTRKIGAEFTINVFIRYLFDITELSLYNHLRMRLFLLRVIYYQCQFFSIEFENVFFFKLQYALLFNRYIFNIQLLSLTAKRKKYLNRCNSCNYIYVRCIIRQNNERFKCF